MIELLLFTAIGHTAMLFRRNDCRLDESTCVEPDQIIDQRLRRSLRMPNERPLCRQPAKDRGLPQTDNLVREPLRIDVAPLANG